MDTPPPPRRGDTFMTYLGSTRHHRALAYGMTNFSAAVLNNIFITYYVEMAVSVSKVSEGWFMTAQIVYCVWNSLNDPACGWFADKNVIETSKGVYKRRTPRIKRGGPMWAVSFILMWFPWGSGDTSPTLAGLHLIVVLMAYDGWLSYTLVNHQALLADMTTDNVERERCTMYGAACQIAGSAAIFFAHMSWDPQNLATFRYYAVAAAVISCVGFQYTSTSKHIDESCGHLMGASPRCTSDTPSLVTFSKQTLKQKNLWSFALMALLQQFSCTFSTNFFSIFLLLLVGRHVTYAHQSAVIYASFVLPHIGTVLLTPVLRVMSKKTVVMLLFAARLGVCLLGLLWVSSILRIPAASVLGLREANLDQPAVTMVGLITGSDKSVAVGANKGTMKLIDSDLLKADANGHTVSLLAFVLAGSLLLNRVLTENVCRLQPLLITDLIDEDCVIHKRRHLMSSMIFGSISLFSKPAQSLAPMVGYHYLSRASSSQLELWMCALSMTFAIPLVFTSLEMIIWTQYRLSGQYLSFIKTAMSHELSNERDKEAEFI